MAVFLYLPDAQPGDGDQPSTRREATVRFSVPLPVSTHKRLKLTAVLQERPMTEIVRELLADWLDKHCEFKQH